MLTVVGHLPTTPVMPGSRSYSLAACGLPDAQGLLELSLREIDAVFSNCQRALHSLGLGQEIVLGDADWDSMDRIRRGLREAIAGCLQQLKTILERIAVRHHPQGRFGASILQMRSEFDTETTRLLADERQLGELATEKILPVTVQSLNTIATEFREVMQRLTSCLANIRRNLHHAKSVNFSHNDWSVTEKNKVRDQLARILARWWQTCSETPGPTTIALINADRIAFDCPELDRAEAVNLLSSTAKLITTDRRAGRATFTFDTPVISNRGEERIISWSCALIEDIHSSVQSILAAGLDRTQQFTAKSNPSLAGAGELSVVSLPSTASPPTDRRRKQRSPFPHVQLIAPCSSSGLPPTTAFAEMQCHDISEDGFSYLAASMPSSTSLVVVLGTKPPHIYLTARVAHFTRCDGSAGINYIVGCQFTSRTMLIAQVP